MLSLGEAPDSGETLTFDLPTFVDINIGVGSGLWSPGAVPVQHLIVLYIHTFHWCLQSGSPRMGRTSASTKGTIFSGFFFSRDETKDFLHLLSRFDSLVMNIREAVQDNFPQVLRHF